MSATPDPTRSAEVEAELRRRFSAQPNVSSSEAKALAHRVASADDVVWQAAEHWVQAGQFPDSPSIQGYTPASLERLGRGGSFVLTALIGLRRDPSAAAITLAHLSPVGHSRTA